MVSVNLNVEIKVENVVSNREKVVDIIAVYSNAEDQITV